MGIYLTIPFVYKFFWYDVWKLSYLILSGKYIENSCPQIINRSKCEQWVSKSVIDKSFSGRKIFTQQAHDVVSTSIKRP